MERDNGARSGIGAEGMDYDIVPAIPKCLHIPCRRCWAGQVPSDQRCAWIPSDPGRLQVRRDEYDNGFPCGPYGRGKADHNSTP